MTRHHRMTIGMIILVTALVLIFWAFSLDCLKSHQHDLLRAVLALAGGFIAWSFHGALDIKITDARWEGVAIGAVGGFGVFLVMLYVFTPATIEVCRGGESEAPKRSTVIQQRLNGLRTEVIAIVADYNNRRPNAELLLDVRKRSADLADQLSKLDSSPLSEAEVVVMHVSAAYANMIACMSEDLMRDVNESYINQCAESTVREASAALRVISALSDEAAQGKGSSDEFARWLRDDSVLDRTRITLATGYSLQQKYSGKGADLALVALKSTDRLFRKQANIRDEPIFKWMCARYTAKDWQSVCDGK